MTDAIYIKRCLDIARLGRGKVAPNPVVGAVIVHNGQIIGEGYHQQVGGPHAEIEALKTVQNHSILKEATIYISLEPCFHYGRTPPCVDSLLSSGFTKVVICMMDPNPMVAGKSFAKLKASGVNLKKEVLKDYGLRQNAFFISTIQQQRPYVILKYAQSANKIFGKHNQQLWISNVYTKRLTHKWRSECGAILVGTNTAIVDNPQLNTRHYYGPSPLRIILDRTLRLPLDGHLLKDELSTLIVTERTFFSQPTSSIEYYSTPFDEHLLSKLLAVLSTKGIDSLLVEGGATTLNHFITQNLWDEARVFSSNQFVSTENSIPAPILPIGSSVTHRLDDNQLDIFYNE